MLKSIIRCASLRSLIMGVASVMMGSAAAVLRGYGDFGVATFCLLFAMLSQILGNLTAVYAGSQRNLDPSALDMTDGEAGAGLPPKQVMGEAIKFTLILLAFVSIALLLTGGWMVFIGLGLVALVVWANNFPFGQVGRTPFGALTCFLTFGPFAVFGTYLLQVQHTQFEQMGYSFELPTFPLPAVGCASITMGLYAVTVMLAYNCTTYDYDRGHGHKTIATIYGKNTCRHLYLIVALIAAIGSATVSYFLPKFPYATQMTVIYALSLFITLHVYLRLGRAQLSNRRHVQNWAMADMLYVALAIFVTLFIGGYEQNIDTKIIF